MSDAYNAAAPPTQGMSPQDIQNAYAALLSKQRDQGKQKQQQPIRSWTQVAAGILDTWADQRNDQRIAKAMMSGQQQGNQALFPDLTQHPIFKDLGGGQPVDSGPVPPQDTSPPPQQQSDNSWSAPSSDWA